MRGFGKIGHRKLFYLTCWSLALSKEDLTSWPAMVDTVHDALAAIQLVLFAILHIALMLRCLALAFLGNSPLIALILGVGGTAGLIGAFVLY